MALTKKKIIDKKFYIENGFLIKKIFKNKEKKILEEFAKNWIYKLTKIKYKDRKEFPLTKYHIWSKKLKLNHSEICNSKKRYIYPNHQIKKIILENIQIKNFLTSINVKKYKIWDDGWGWLGFRLIRPKKNDGYPFSRKEWGVAKNVISCWCPIIGLTKKETLSLIKKSHKKNYDNYLPINSKFTKGEFRLSKKYKNIKIFNPNLHNNEIIFYDPRLLHSENTQKNKITRLNLEFRFNPL